MIVHVAVLIAGSSLRMTPGRNLVLAQDADYDRRFLTSMASTTTRRRGKK
jgi:hypothetical protein